MREKIKVMDNLPPSLSQRNPSRTRSYTIEQAVKRLLKITFCEKAHSHRVSIPKPLAEHFLDEHGQNVRWELHERGLLLVSAMGERERGDGD